ncbi:uncharacterized protein LOC123717039 [Pieris brassicae]|uniref:uncharacterized protein LOC123717039 n=1 Tax=Pieris brassicae TaxID=7116 RepID=UPI001E65FB20|nr:uncharacterized protein LOC123717039 [Pieris brassicae]
MPYYCTVPRCTSMAGKAKNVSFHQFPRDEELAKLWNRVLKRGKPYTKYSKVCSLHFKPEDYTITSAQKNRGQWRTLRKDAIPSRNLPSESPAEDWHRKNTSTFQLPTSLDTSVQHQMAQAIYVQTMLAMQAAGINETNNVSTPVTEHSSPSNSDSQNEDDTQTTMQQEKKNTIPPEKVTYECHQCSKCFKDPDVFILHQRNHVKTENNAEMLKANPILANLLKTDSESNKNVISIENQIMSALTENMANYLQNLSTIMTNTALDNSMHSIVKGQYGTNLIEADSSNSTSSEDLIKETISDPQYCEEGSHENTSKFIDESDAPDVMEELGSGAL